MFKHIIFRVPLNQTRCLSTGLILRNQQSKNGFVGSSSTSSDQSNGEHNEEEDEGSRIAALGQEKRIRRFKKIFSTLLFTSTIGLALWARKRKLAELEKNVEGCTCLGADHEFAGSHKVFFRCKREPTKDDFSGQNTGGECVLPSEMVTSGVLRKVKSFEVLPDDIIVASFPKTGTTLVQEICYLLVNNLDFDKASKEVLEKRFPFLEYPYPGIQTIKSMKTPRLIKTHLPYFMLPESISNSNPKIIYVIRNPRDCLVSYFHFAKMLNFSSYSGSFNSFVEKFKKNKLPYTPFFGHIESYLNRKDDANILILTYEDLLHDPADAIRKIARFLQIPLTDSDLNSLIDHTKFENMKKNSSVNYEHWDSIGFRNKGESNFMRKGQIGDWKNYFNSGDIKASFEDWEKEANRIGFKFKYE